MPRDGHPVSQVASFYSPAPGPCGFPLPSDDASSLKQTAAGLVTSNATVGTGDCDTELLLFVQKQGTLVVRSTITFREMDIEDADRLESSVLRSIASAASVPLESVVLVSKMAGSVSWDLAVFFNPLQDAERDAFVSLLERDVSSIFDGDIKLSGLSADDNAVRGHCCLVREKCSVSCTSHVTY